MARSALGLLVLVTISATVLMGVIILFYDCQLLSGWVVVECEAGGGLYYVQLVLLMRQFLKQLWFRMAETAA